MLQTKVVENNRIHILCSITFFNRTIYEITWKNKAEPDRAQMTIWHMHIACWVPKVANTHSEYVVLIALTQQKWLHRHASLLRYTYVACLVFLTNHTRKVGCHNACKASL